jgi:DNA polymerase-1
MAAPDKIVLVDGSAMLYRAFFAIPSRFTTKDGLHTNAIYGFTLMFKKLFGGRHPTHGAVVFDAPGKKARDEVYEAYKANREKMPDDLREQLPWIDKVVHAHKFPLLRVPGVEADDVIGTLARQARERGAQVVIVSADKDFAQLIDDDVRMQDTIKDVVYDPELVRKKWGVPPHQIVDLLALWGDKSDNIPGVPGVGQKGAGQLLEQYGSLEGIYDHIEELKGKKKQNLLDHKDDAYLSRRLATIDQHVDLDGTTLEDLAITAPTEDERNALYRELEFFSLLSDKDAAGAVDEGMDFRVLWSTDEVTSFVDAIPAGAECAVEVVYEGVNPATGDITGLALSAKPESGVYVPLLGPTPDALGRAGVQALKPFFEDGARPKIAHNAKLLCSALRRHDVGLEGVAGDTMLASFLVDPTGLIPHELLQVSKEYLQRIVAPEKGVIGSGKKQRLFREVDPEKVGAWACHRAEIALTAWPLVKKRCEEEGQLAHLFEDDLPLSWVLSQMELDGIRVDPAELKKMGVEFQTKLDGLSEDIYKHAGRTFNIASTKQLSDVLFDELKLPVIKRTKTGYSTNAEVLERLAEKGHEIAELLLEHRKLAKLINTYTEVLSAAVNPATGRVHATFQQTVGATGRLITTDPDLQRTPVRTPEGARIRETFIAPEGHQIISADWSQIELRILAHVTEDPVLIDCYTRGIDVHRRTASEIFGVDVDAVSREQREAGKTVNFATIYGQGATALGQMLKIKRAEAKRYIEGYFDTYKGVKAWVERVVAEADQRGYVETLDGRRRYIPELLSNNSQDRSFGERVAANTPIQGSGADICKRAMLNIARRFGAEGLKSRMVCQIHDEVLVESPDAEVEAAQAIVVEEMRGAADLKVPLLVDAGHGRSWGDAKA